MIRWRMVPMSKYFSTYFSLGRILSRDNLKSGDEGSLRSISRFTSFHEKFIGRTHLSYVMVDFLGTG